MSLTAKDVDRILQLLEDSSFDELELEMDGLKLVLRRSSLAGAAAPTVSMPARAAAGAETAARTVAAIAPAALPQGVSAVPATMLGTFYRAPKPGAPPYVAVGSEVAPDTIIGIIEVMKLMNTVRAGVTGTVIEVVAADGALVEFGAALIHVRSAD